eukprot:1067173-Ditylum_brightwellii.AAC.1
MASPADKVLREEGDREHHICYGPKKCVHQFTGHTKGVHYTQIFPKMGHLLLSGELDGKCKVWARFGQM